LPKDIYAMDLVQEQRMEAGSFGKKENSKKIFVAGAGQRNPVNHQANVSPNNRIPHEGSVNGTIVWAPQGSVRMHG
jgi:hypothetical protein